MEDIKATRAIAEQVITECTILGTVPAFRKRELRLAQTIFALSEKGAAFNPSPVSMFTEVGSGDRHEISVVVLRGEATIELFCRWAERNGVLNRDRDVEGNER